MNKIRKADMDKPAPTDLHVLRRSAPFRFLLPPVLTICLAAATIFLVALPAFETKMMTDKRQKLVDLVNTAWSMFDDLDKEVQAGQLTLEEAQAQGIHHLRSMRYGPDNKDYYWINDMTPIVIMHPHRPDLENMDVGTFEDPDGKRLFIAAAETVAASGAGFIDYQWQWKDDPTRIVPKLSYVRGFEPWGWVIGTGVYLEDVREEMAAVSHRMLAVFLAILMLVAALSVWLVLQSARAERRVHESRERFRVVMDGLDTLVYVADLETYEILFVNRYGLETWGDIVGRTCWKTMQSGLTGPCEHCPNDRLLDADGEPTGIVRWESRNTVNRRWYENRDQVIRWTDGRLVRMGIATDITARKEAETERVRLEQQLMHAQKMEAIGNLAGGVAHDFNNLLAAIMGHAQLIEEEADDGSDLEDSAKSIFKASRRAADLTQQLLDFSRMGRLRVETLDLHEIIRDTVQLLERSIDPRIGILTDLQAHPSHTRGDPTQLQNALLNLGVNARDAMPDGGTLSITTHNLILGEADVRRSHPDARPGAYIMVKVTDTGVGMTEEVRRGAFEPFFTTKGPEGGTGLGLAGVYGCVKSHQGLIEVSSTPNLGTQFTILLPLVNATEPKPETAAPTIPGQGVVLLVDDEPHVRNFAGQALRVLGYQVVACEDGEQAVTWFREHPDEADLVLLDLIMPKMNGQETFAALRAIRPDIRILIISGFADEKIGTTLLAKGGCEFIAKPFTLQELSARIAHLIPQVSRRTD